MKLFLISQDVNTDYDTYDSFVVAAKNAEDAKTVVALDAPEYSYGSWVKRVEDIKVIEIGTAKHGTKREVILGSFHAG